MPKITFDSDEEFEFDEDTAQQKTTDVVAEETDSDSDDDAAPEAVSTSSLRNKAVLAAKAQKDAALSQLKTEKEKRRQKDLQLKQQKQGSRREQKQQQKQQPEAATQSNSDHESDDGRLPQDVLAALTKEEDEELSKDEMNPAAKRTHLTMADFEAMQADQEAELERQLNEQRKKQKKEAQGRKVGEYTVKVLNNRPQVAKAGKNLQYHIKDKLNRKSVVRQNAVIGGSASRLSGGALVFRRQPVSGPKRK